MAWRKDMENAPRDGTIVDLWVWRGDGDIIDCYFPKMEWCSDGYWYVVDDWEIQVFNADLWRLVEAPK